MFYKSLDGSKTPQQHLELNRLFIAIFGLVENIGKVQTVKHIIMCKRASTLCNVGLHAGPD